MNYNARTKSQAGCQAARGGVRLLLLSLWFVFGHTVAEEQLEQEPIVIKGNQGLPGTIFIAPWKRSGAPLPNEKLQGDIGEETEPLERDLFQRELELQREGYGVDPAVAPQVPHTSPADS